MPRNRPLPFHVPGQTPLYPDSVEVPAAVIAHFLDRLTPFGDRGCQTIRCVDEEGNVSARNLNNYCKVTWTGADSIRRTVPAHRLALTLKSGPVPSDLLALHRCDVPACCGLDHAYGGSAAMNRADAAYAERARRYGWAPTLHPYGRERMCAEVRPG